MSKAIALVLKWKVTAILQTAFHLQPLTICPNFWQEVICCSTSLLGIQRDTKALKVILILYACFVKGLLASMEEDSLHTAFCGHLPGGDGSVLWYSIPAYGILAVVLKHGYFPLQPGKGLVHHILR